MDKSSLHADNPEEIRLARRDPHIREGRLELIMISGQRLGARDVSARVEVVRARRPSRRCTPVHQRTPRHRARRSGRGGLRRRQDRRLRSRNDLLHSTGGARQLGGRRRTVRLAARDWGGHVRDLSVTSMSPTRLAARSGPPRLPRQRLRPLTSMLWTGGRMHPDSQFNEAAGCATVSLSDNGLVKRGAGLTQQDLLGQPPDDRAEHCVEVGCGAAERDEHLARRRPGGRRRSWTAR